MVASTATPQPGREKSWLANPDYSRIRAIERRALQSEAMGLCIFAWGMQQGAFRKHPLPCS